jgi:hypothetical protein
MWSIFRHEVAFRDAFQALVDLFEVIQVQKAGAFLLSATHYGTSIDFNLDNLVDSSLA